MDQFDVELLASTFQWLQLPELAAVASCAKAYLPGALHDIHWRPRVLRRVWALAPGGLSGSEAVDLFYKHHGADPSCCSERELIAALVSRGKSSQSISKEFGGTLGSGPERLRRALAAIYAEDLPTRPGDGENWWRQFYRGLAWGEILRLGMLYSPEPGVCFGWVKRLFVGRNVHWGVGWDARYLELTIDASPEFRVFGIDQTLLAQLFLADAVGPSWLLHGQEVNIPPHRVALRWPEDVQSKNGSPLMAWSTPALLDGQTHLWSFVVLGLDVDVLFRCNSYAQREAWLERLNAAALATQGVADLGALRPGGVLADLGAVQTDGSEWQRMGLRKTETKGLACWLEIKHRREVEI